MLVAALILVGLNLRGPIVGIPPGISEISADLTLSPAVAGLLTSVPLLCSRHSRLSRVRWLGE